MRFTSIYKNGKPDYFFITADRVSEFAFIRPYFIVTTCEKTKHGNIKFMENLTGDFKGIVTFYGKAYHGYGYSHSADVYNELINIIELLYKDKLSEEDVKELNAINTHENDLKLSDNLLKHLAVLNEEI